VIEEIRIRSLGVIEESVLELGPGLNVVTGETGAGKTMLVTALGLLLGARADAGAVRAGAPSARVDGLVRVGAQTAAEAEQLGADVEDDTLLIGRQLQAGGRSRAFLGGAAVPVSSLQGLADRLVAVHGQSDQRRLLQTDTHRQALDGFAGPAVAELLPRVAAGHAELRRVEAELQEVVSAARERAQEADVLRLGLAEIEAVDPQPGEDTELAAEESRLGHADTLRMTAESARESLSSDQDSPDALGAVAAARSALEQVRELDPQAGQLADRVAEVSYLLSDVAADVASYSTGLETDPARLAAVSERRAALGALTRKYGDTIEEVLAWSQQSAQRLLELDHSEGHIAGLRARREELRRELGRDAALLSVARQQAAGELAARVTAELTSLAMPHARIEVVVTQTEADAPEGIEVDGRCLRCTSTGLDEVELLLAANSGATPRPLAKGASGGELSRVMLALEVVLAGTSPVPTFVFDEVDAGVGGKAAVEIGRRLAALAGDAQVLVVTHLPQVAAFADRHVVVHKSSDGAVTTSGLTVLDDEGRVRELSRMLAGLEASETAMAHAEELLAVARPDRARRRPR
jgi:DNA repair protein RecN (Recombination protein N)